MKYITTAEYYEINGTIWAINSNKSGCYTQILKQLIGQLDVMLEHHNKVLVIRFDLSLNRYTSNNRDISEFNRRLSKSIKAKYQLKRIGFAWAREMETSKHQHYHYALFVDGNKVNTSHSILHTVEKLWMEEMQAGRYWRPDNAFQMIHRGNFDEQQEVVYRISYLAKGRGKGYRDAQAKDYSTSRIKSP